MKKKRYRKRKKEKNPHGKGSKWLTCREIIVLIYFISHAKTTTTGQLKRENWFLKDRFFSFKRRRKSPSPCHESITNNTKKYTLKTQTHISRNSTSLCVFTSRMCYSNSLYTYIYNPFIVGRRVNDWMVISNRSR